MADSKPRVAKVTQQGYTEWAVIEDGIAYPFGSDKTARLLAESAASLSSLSLATRGYAGVEDWTEVTT